MALLGQAHLRSASTGATIEIIRFIPPPADWVGKINAEGLAGVISTNPLAGYVNAEGFAPGVAFDTYATGLFGSLSAQGFAPTVGISQVAYYPQVGVIQATGNQHDVNPDFATFFPSVGIAQAKTADGASLELTKFFPGMTPGEMNLEGFNAPVAGDPGTVPVGYANLEGFAPNVTKATIIQPEVGIISALAQGTTADVEKVKTIDGPYLGEVNATGSIATVVRVAPDVTFPEVGEANVEGFSATISLERTQRPSVGIINAQGFLQSTAKPGVFTPLVGVVNVSGYNATITSGRWTPVGGETNTWTSTDPSRRIWFAVGEESSTWTPVDKAS